MAKRAAAEKTAYRVRGTVYRKGVEYYDFRGHPWRIAWFRPSPVDGKPLADLWDRWGHWQTAEVLELADLYFEVPHL